MIDAVRVGVLVVSAVAAVASATAPAKYKVKRTAAVSASFDEVWSSLIDVFADHAWAISTMDKSSGVITTDWMELHSRAHLYADCGDAGLLSEQRTQIMFNVRLKEDDRATAITVTANFRERRRFGEAVSFAACMSRGAVERLIHREVTKRSKRLPKRERKKPASPPTPPPPVAEPRGYFCSSSPSNPDAGFCTREKAACATARDAAMAVVSDLSSCALTEVAYCRIDTDQCRPTLAACEVGAMECEERD